MPAIDDQLLTLIEEAKPDAIITFYRHTLRILTQLLELNNLRIPVHTVHSIQGLEYNRILIVQSASQRGEWGLNGDINYLRTALTRAVDSVTLLTVGYQYEANNLLDLLNKRGK